MFHVGYSKSERWPQLKPYLGVSTVKAYVGSPFQVVSIAWPLHFQNLDYIFTWYVSKEDNNVLKFLFESKVQINQVDQLSTSGLLPKTSLHSTDSLCTKQDIKLLILLRLVWAWAMASLEWISVLQIVINTNISIL